MSDPLTFSPKKPKLKTWNRMSLLTKRTPPPRLPVYPPGSPTLEWPRSSRWTTLNTTDKITELHSTCQARWANCPASRAAENCNMGAGWRPSRHPLFMISMRAIASNRSFTIAETTVKVWAELLVAWAVIIDMRVSVKPSDWPDMRAKRTSTDQLIITKKFVNKAEALAQNICKSPLQSRQFCQMPRGNLSSTLKTSTEAYKLFTGKGEPLKPKPQWISSQTIKSQCKFHTKRTWRTFSQDTGYTNKEPERCLPSTSVSCDPNSWKNAQLNNFISRL